MTREEQISRMDGAEGRSAAHFERALKHWKAPRVASIPCPPLKIGIRIPRAFGFRLWLGTRLLALAGRVFGKPVDVEVTFRD